MLVATRDFSCPDPVTGEPLEFKGPRLVDGVWQEADQITDPAVIATILADDVLRTYVLIPA